MPADAPGTVARAIAATRALAPWIAGRGSGTVWVGFSGGRDSTVLLHALRGIAGVAATHIDHGLNVDSGAWARHCASVAAQLGVRFEARRVHVAAEGNLERAARHARYAAWRGLLRPGDLLALAHTANDQAETRLWQLLTGREPGGMPAERGVGSGILARPVLGISRSTIARYAEHHGLRWIEDPSNADLTLDRNYIRERVVPRIEERFPDAMQRLARPRPVAGIPRSLAVRAASERAIEDWLRVAGLPVAGAAVAEVGRQSAAGPDRTPRVRIAPGVQAWRHAAGWHLVRDPAPLGIRAATVGSAMPTVAGTLGWRRCARGLLAGLPIAVRARVGGERIRVHGRGVTKPVKALLREAGVPPWRRPGWPLLYADGRLVAIAGLAIADDAVVGRGWRPLWSPAPDF